MSELGTQLIEDMRNALAYAEGHEVPGSRETAVKISIAPGPTASRDRATRLWYAEGRKQRSMMALANALKSVQFVTDGAGHRTAVLLDIQAWEALMAWIEDATDTRLAARALHQLAEAGGRPSKAGWVAWEDASEEWLEKEGR